MLEGGADIRYVQELLGHRSLASTHIYTRVAPERLPPCTPPPTPAPPCPADASFLFSRSAALVSGRGAARWDTRDHDGSAGADHGVPEKPVNAPPAPASP